MVANWAAFWAQMGETAIYTALVPLVLGGALKLLKPWIATEDDIRKRVHLQQHAVTERQATELNRILESVRNFDANLRGSTPQDDLLGLYSKHVFRGMQEYEALNNIYACTKTAHSLLLILTIIALVCMLVAIPYADARPYVTLISYCLIILDVVIVVRLRIVAKHLEQLERTN